MKPRLHLLVAVALASASVAFGIHRLASASSYSPPPVVHASVPARPASYLGVFVDGAPPGYDPIADFAHAAKAQPNLVGYDSGWAQPFDASFAKMILAHGVHPFVQIDPTDVSMQRKVFLPTIDQVRRLTDKPILLSETAVGPRAGRYFGITDLFDGMRLYKILGLVWFDEKQDDGINHQDWRIEGNKFAESAFKSGISELTLSPPSP